MKRWELQCVNRDTGNDAVLVVFAEDEESAFAEASSRNHVVAKVVASTEVPEGISPDEDNNDRPSPSALASTWIDNQFSAPVAMTALGRILLVAGVVAIVYSFLMDTTVSGSNSFDRVHNIGLLNSRLVFVFLGSMSFLSGVLLQCTAQILRALQK